MYSVGRNLTYIMTQHHPAFLVLIICMIVVGLYANLKPVNIWDQYEKCLDNSMLLPSDLCGCAKEVYLEDHFDGFPDGKPNEATQLRSFQRCVRLTEQTDQDICDCAKQVRREDWCE